MPDLIASRKNQLFRHLQKLDRDPDTRRQEGKFLVWGFKLVEEALHQPGRVVQLVLGETASVQPSLKSFLRGARRHGIPVAVLSDSLLNQLAPGAADQGILALFRMAHGALESLLGAARRPLVLVADRVQDPGNLGSLVRLGGAASVTALLTTAGTADPYHTRAVRASAGSILHLPTCPFPDPDEWRRLSRAQSMRTAVALARGGVPPHEADLRGALAVVVGNEGEGVSRERVEAADLRLTVALGGSVESLNVAAATAIILYEAFRQRVAP